MTTRTLPAHALPGLKAVALASALVVVASGCGGSDDGDDGGSASPAEGSSICDAESADPDWQATLEAARDEGAVQVWSSVNQASMDNVEQAFNEACPGIQAEITTYGVSDMTVRVEAEQESGSNTVDFLIKSGRDWQNQHAEYFSAISGPQIEESQAAVASAAGTPSSPAEVGGAPQSDQLLYDEDTRLLTLLGPWGYAWNKGAVSEEPTFEEIFSDDAFTGRVGMVDPAVAPLVTLLYMRLQERYPDLYDGLSEIEPQIYASVPALAQGLAAGEVDVALAIDAATPAAMPNVGFAYDDQFPPLATPVYAASMETAPHSNASQVFANWLMSPEGQEVLTRGYVSPVPGVTDFALADVEAFEADGLDPAVISEGLETINAALGR